MGASLRCTSCENDLPVDPEPWLATIDFELEQLMKLLFQLHDLDKDGVLAENELIQLNKKAAKLHYGAKVTKEEVAAKYRELFRSCLDSDGKPVPYLTFRKYMLGVLVARDPSDVQAQKMILEQLVAEAAAARAAFHIPSLESASDAPFLATISFDEGVMLPGGSRLDQPRSPGLPSVAEDVKTASPPKRQNCDWHVGSPLSTAASTTACSSKYRGADAPTPQARSAGLWQCSPMACASFAFSLAREDGLCSLCVDDRVEVARRQQVDSCNGPQDSKMSWNSLSSV